MTAIVVLDTETTGKERQRDQIIELCIQLGLEDAECRGWRFKPTVPIHAEAQAVHGITMESLAACPSFATCAGEVLAYLNAADVIVGFNVRFDLDMIQDELVRAGLPPLDLTAKTLIDAMRLWQHFEPRTLVAAHEKFIGLPLVDAHAASADVAATGAVLVAMLSQFGLAGENWAEVAKVCDPLPERHRWVGPSNHIQWREDGQALVLGFGKYRGVALHEVDPGFLNWAIGKDFPAHVKEAFAAALRMSGLALLAWATTRYPRRRVEAA